MFSNTFQNTNHSKRRIEVLQETLESIRLNGDFFYRKAQSNLAKWAKDSVSSVHKAKIEVHSGDWGEITGELTEKYGVCFAVLNMANSTVPGGGYLQGLVAQEENMFRRTDCHFSIENTQIDENGYYKQAIIDLINGVNNRVYLDLKNPRICIRGKENRERTDLGYEWLTENKIFPFYEMRSAALDLRSGISFSEEECTKRIRAQFNTLKNAKIQHVVLGAHGCGAFLNPPKEVARIYKSVIEEFEDNFKIIAFAIFNAGYGPDNYSIFKAILNER
jgi:hypothetical protein